jgi:hypothetical protein
MAAVELIKLGTLTLHKLTVTKNLIEARLE